MDGEHPVAGHFCSVYEQSPARAMRRRHPLLANLAPHQTCLVDRKPPASESIQDNEVGYRADRTSLAEVCHLAKLNCRKTELMRLVFFN